jgi:hypothetical protein
MKEAEAKKAKKRKNPVEQTLGVTSIMPPPVQPDPDMLPLVGSTPPIANPPVTPPPLPPIVAKTKGGKRKEG